MEDIQFNFVEHFYNKMEEGNTGLDMVGWEEWREGDPTELQDQD